MVATVPPPAPPPNPPPLSPKPVALRFSNVFIPGPAKRQAELAFVDVLLDTDIPLFVDPFAFKIESSAWAEECNDLVVSFFQELVDAIKCGQEYKARSLLNNLHEPNEVHLGLSRGKPSGRGVGSGQAKSVYHAFAQSKAVKTGILSDLSDCELFIDGISSDKISDITINIIRRKLVEFTVEQCRLWGVPTSEKPTGPYWHAEEKEWRNGYDQLPVYHGQPVILVPKRAVRYKLAIDDRDYFDHHVVVYYQNEFAQQESVNSNASLTRLLQHGRRKGPRVTKKAVKEKIEFSKEMLREFSEEHPEVLKKYKEQAEQAAIAGKHKPSDSGIHEKVREVAHSQERILIEELTVNVINGDNYGAVGQGNTVRIRDITVYKADVDNSPAIDPGTRDLLKQAIDAIEAANATDQDKDEAKDDLHKLTEELKKAREERQPGVVRRYLAKIAAVMPSVATILSKGKEIVEALGGLPVPGMAG